MAPGSCLAARQRLSLRLDGESSRHDELRLAQHLARCPDCAAWAAALEVTVSTLRGAELARPSCNVDLPRRGLRTRQAGAAAVAAVAAVAVAVLSGRVDSMPRLAPYLSPSVVRSQLTLKERQLSRIDLPKPEPGGAARPSLPSGAFGRTPQEQRQFAARPR